MTQKNNFIPTVISVTWGKSNNYIPASNEPFVWDGSLTVLNGTVLSLDHLHYKFFMWVQSVEVAERIFDKNWHALLKLGAPDLKWKSSVTPGDPGGLEGIRFSLQGDASTVIIMDMAPVKIQFTLGELLDREHLRYHAGGRYSGVPIDVFLGPDARPRVSRKKFLKELNARQGAGWAVMPEEWSGATVRNEHSMCGALVSPGAAALALFPVENYDSHTQGNCLVKIQMTALLESYTTEKSRWMDMEIRLGQNVQLVHHLFTTRAHLMKLEEIYVSVPWRTLARHGNELTIRNNDNLCPLFIHRVYIGATRPSHHEALQALPQLPAQPALWIGYDTNLLTPANGEMDRHIQMLREEELGNFILFRERGSEGSAEDLSRWAAKLVEYNFRAITCDASNENERILAAQAGSQYLGALTHEISNLTYGWGQADPIEERIKRTLPDCHAFYLTRMAPYKITGQAAPLQHLDYEAGVDLVLSEIPGGNATLCQAGATQRVVLLNTDWTSTGNCKPVTLHTCVAEIPLKVREGRLTQVLLQDDFAVVFETLPAIVDELQCDKNKATFRVAGAGMAMVRICTPRKLKSILVDGQTPEYCAGELSLDFGAKWKRQIVEINYA